MSREPPGNLILKGIWEIKRTTDVPVEPRDVERLSQAGYLSKDGKDNCLYPGPFHVVAFQLDSQNLLTITAFRLFAILGIIGWLFVPLFSFSFASLVFVTYSGAATLKTTAFLIAAIVSIAWTLFCNRHWQKEYDYPGKVQELLENN